MSHTERFLNLVDGKSSGACAMAARAGLWIASGPYSLAMSIRNRLFDHGWKRISRAAVPVVSVGNLTTGGTGKTPCVEYLARFFRDLGVQVAILSRGYGGDGGPNDEALVLEENLNDVPHLQGSDRSALAATAIEELESELLILDDGFQHRRLARDFDIVLVDATSPWGFGHVLPRGLLREPRSALRRAHAVLITRCDQAAMEAIAELRQEIASLVTPGTLIVETTHAPAMWLREGGEVRPINSLGHARAAAFCGLGNPDAFRNSLKRLGIIVDPWRVFPDHHNYTRVDVDDLRRWAMELPAGTPILTTQKDAVKLRLADLAGHPLWALKIELAITDGEASRSLYERLTRLVSPAAAVDSAKSI